MSTLCTNNTGTWKGANLYHPSWDSFTGGCMLHAQISRIEPMFVIYNTLSTDKVVSRLNKCAFSFLLFLSLLRQLTEHYLLWLPFICDCLSVKWGRTIFPTSLNDWQLVVCLPKQYCRCQLIRCWLVRMSVSTNRFCFCFFLVRAKAAICMN